MLITFNRLLHFKKLRETIYRARSKHRGDTNAALYLTNVILLVQRCMYVRECNTYRRCRYTYSTMYADSEVQRNFCTFVNRY